MTIEDVRADLRHALRSGYDAGHGSHGGGTAPQGLDELGQARWDGERLGHAVTRLISADLADYAADSRNYAQVAGELNERYGARDSGHQGRSGSRCHARIPLPGSGGPGGRR